MLIRPVILLLVLACLMTGKSYAQIYQFRNFDITDGLYNSEVYDIHEDKKGYLWLATNGGAYRFDGLEFVNFSTGEGLSSPSIRSVFSKGNLSFIGTTKGLNILKDYAFSHTLLPTDEILQITSYGNKTIFLSADALCVYKGKDYEVIFSRPEADMTCMHTTGDSIWIGTQDNGMVLLTPKGEDLFVEKYDGSGNSEVPMKVRGLASNPQGELWIASLDKGISYFDEGYFNRVSFEEEKNYLYSSISYDPINNSFWCGTWGNGLVEISRSQIQTFNESNGLPNNSVISVAVTPSGMVYCGSFTHGLSQFISNSTVYFNSETGLPDDNVRSIHVMNEITYISTLAGVVAYDGVEINKISGPASKIRGGHLYESNNQLYVTSYSGGLYRIDSLSSAELISPSQIRTEILSITGRNNDLYLGTYGLGIAFLSGAEVTILPGSEKYKQIWAIHAFNDKLAIGTNQEVVIYDFSTRTYKPLIANHPLLADTRINQLGSEKRPDALLIATENNGMFLYDTTLLKPLRKLTTREGLPSNSVRGFTYQDQTLILATNIGVVRVDFDKAIEIQKLLDISEFGRREINANCIVNNKGKLWVGTGFGAIRFDFDLSQGRRYAEPNVWLAHVLSRDRAFSTDSLKKLDRVIFPYEKNHLEFDLRGVNMNSSEWAFIYTLKSERNEITRSSKESLISFHNLDPGDYVFSYYLEDSYGNKSETKQFKFTIESPYWQNWEFLLILIVGAVGLFGAILYVFRPRKDLNIRKKAIGQSTFVSRLILFFGTIVYPLVLFLDSQVDDRIANPKIGYALLLTAVFFSLAVLSFFSEQIKSRLKIITIIGYCALLAHLIWVISLNHIVPSHVVILVMVIMVSSIVFDSYLGIVLIGIVINMAVIYISTNAIEPLYNPSQLLVSSTTASLIALLILGVRLNLINRLQVSDTVLNSIDSLVMVADKSGRIVFAGKSVTRLLGYKRSEVLGEGWWKIRGGGERDKQLVRNEELMRDSGSQLYVTQVPTKDGNMRYYRWTDTMLPNGMVAGVGHDVTDVYKMELEMKRLSIVARETTSGVVITDPETKIEWANDSFLKFMGYEMEEIIGKKPPELFGRKTPETDGDKYVTEGTIKQPYDITVENFKKDGTSVWLHIVGTPIFDSNGDIGQIIEVIQDVTKSREQAKRLEQLSLVATKTDNYVMITDAEDRVVWTNDSFSTIFGYDFSEVQNKKVRDFLATERLNPEVIFELRQRIFEHKSNFIGEFCDRRKDGTLIWVSTNITPVTDDEGEIEYIISIGTDITERKIQEFQLQQISRANALMHGIDNILINDSESEDTIQKILSLIMEQDSNIFLGAYFEMDFNSLHADVTIRHHNGDPEFWTKRDISTFSSINVLRSGQPYLSDNIMDQEDLSETDKWLMMNRIRSYLMVPIKRGEEVVAVLGVGAKTPHYFSENDIETYVNIADSMAVVQLQQDQKQELEIKEANFRQLNESISEAFWLLDALTGKVLFVNHTFLKIFEVTEKEMFDNPKNWAKNIHPEDKLRIIKQYNESYLKGTFEMEFRIVKGKTIRWVQAKSFVIKNEQGDTVRTCGSATDVTDRKTKEAKIIALNDQLSTLNRLNTVILNDQNVGELLLEIFEDLFSFTKILRLNIVIYDFQAWTARYHFLLSTNEIIYPETDFSLDNFSGKNLKELREHRFVYSRHLTDRKDLSNSDEKMRDMGISSYLMHPLIHKNKLIGSLNVSFADDFDLSEDAIGKMKLISEGISISLYQKILQDQIERDKLELEQVYSDLSDSITYAKKFQESRLPDLSELKEVFNSAAVFYKPKDVVSGDFYWEERVGNSILFAAADCTGHGVPGAFMTVLFNMLLDRVVFEKGITSPSEVLQQLHFGLLDYFSDAPDKLLDGMDIALCSYDTLSKTLTYSGAHRPLYIYRAKSKEIEVFNGVLSAVGDYMEDFPFMDETIPVNRGDVLYLTSDGIFDQFNPSNKKYGKKRFLKLVENKSSDNPEEIAEQFRKELVEWMGLSDQIDDMLVLIVKV